LLSVYHKEEPDFLVQAINSIINQTSRPNEIILVRDGPLNQELNNVINKFKELGINKKNILNNDKKEILNFLNIL
jgi:glycosyltransferase involved in cell wall biosynthesis